MSTGRLESFSDGVIAVAITLLVLNIGVPAVTKADHLGRELTRQWPVYAAYATSFITIGIIWINHHVMVGRLARADHSIMILNLILLATIGVIPFGTRLVADFLREGHGANLAAAIYAGIFLLMAIAFSMLNWQILLRRPELLSIQLSFKRRREIWVRAATGLIPYVIATALAAVSPYVTLAICAGLAVFYALPIASSIGVSEG